MTSEEHDRIIAKGAKKTGLTPKDYKESLDYAITLWNLGKGERS